jgi:hypothetical protein
LNGRRVFEKEEKMWKMINDLETQQQQKLMKCKDDDGSCENRQ